MTPGNAQVLALLAAASACSANDKAPSSGELPEVGDPAAVQVVMFTHIEDNTPAGALGSDQGRVAYAGLRARLVELARLARARELTWVLQPDWKILEMARVYEDAAATASTGGKNVFAYLHEDLGVPIDPHSHENGGYNYTDVAHLLELLGVGGSTVIGGHIWDPSLPQFQEWDRFRGPVAGAMYPSASWRGDILMGAGTPNHVNDPLVSGVWRPRDRDHFFEDDPSANIIAFGAWTDEVAGVEALVTLREEGRVPETTMLTASWNIVPSQIITPTGPADIDASVFAPIADLRDRGAVVVTDFSSLAAAWQARGAVAGTYAP